MTALDATSVAGEYIIAVGTASGNVILKREFSRLGANYPICHNYITTLKFSPDGQILAIGDKECQIHLWPVNQNSTQIAYKLSYVLINVI